MSKPLQLGDFSGLGKSYSENRPDYCEEVLHAILGVLKKRPDEIIAAESGGTTVDALRAARGVGKYTKGPRKGKRRGPDTIAVRDAETGELLHFNEIELTSSSARGYVGRKQGQSPTGKKRGFIRARSYTGRQNHKIVDD